MDLIKNELRPKTNYVLDAKEKIKKIKSQYPDYQIVSLHFRRGDIAQNSISQGKIDFYGGKKLDLNSINGKYLTDSKSIFKSQKVKFLIFCFCISSFSA